MLESNALQGSIPDTVEKLTKLEVLILSSNMMDGSLPDELGNLTDLRKFILVINVMLCLRFETLTFARTGVLELANNTFIGVIPADLANLSRLEVLDLSGNNFSGTVPENICLDLVFLEALLVDCSESLVIDDCPCCVCQATYS
jgi:Leucine-rich repeat (LRR) protein